MSPRFTLKASRWGGDPANVVTNVGAAELVAALMSASDTDRVRDALLIVEMNGALVARIACRYTPDGLRWRTEPVKAGA